LEVHADMRLTRKWVRNKKFRAAQAIPAVRVQTLQLTALRALRLYRRIATDRIYAVQIARAMRFPSHPALKRLIQPLYRRRIEVLGTGFNVCFLPERPAGCFGLSTVVVEVPNPNAIRLQAIARELIPLYRRIARNRLYAARIARAINTNNRAALGRIVREAISSPRLSRTGIIQNPITDELIGFEVILRFGTRSYSASIN
jgi:hypothetical protein